MATLTETAYYTRRTINWIILGIIAYIILRIFWSIFIGVFLAVFPPKPPPPNHAFGTLPKLQFPRQATPSASLTFQLETIEGTVPPASESAAVYFMPKKPANLLALNKTQAFAKRLNLDPNPIQESKNIYRFNDPETPLRRLRYDIVSDNFVLRYAFEQDAGLFTEKKLPLQDAAIAEARDMLQTHDLMNEDIERGTPRVSFLRLTGDRLVTTTSLSQADSVRVDFFRQSIADTPIITPYSNEGPVSIVFSGSTNVKKKVLQFAYTFWPIDYTTVATYALKSSALAWQELQSDLGYIAQYPQTGNVAIVRNIYLAYYDSFEPQNYLQPVFVFDGDNGFRGIVPAVAPPWTE